MLVVTSGDKRVDEAKVAAQVGGPLERADADFVKASTGFAIGGVAPVAHAQPPVTLIDRELFRFEEIWAAAGHPNGVFKLSPRELEQLTGAPVAEVTSMSATCARASTGRSPRGDACRWSGPALGPSMTTTAPPRFRRRARTCAAWTRAPAGAKAACARSTRSPAGRRWTMSKSAACGVRSSVRRASLVPRPPSHNARTGMKHLTFYLDAVSPFAYLAFEQLPQMH